MKIFRIITLILVFNLLSIIFSSSIIFAATEEKWAENAVISLDNGPDLINIMFPHYNPKSSQSWTNISYANISQSEKMDIYLPNTTNGGPYPVIIFIHGGGGYSGDKDCLDSQELVKHALKRGYAVVTINYRLSEEAKFPAQINDVKAATKYVRANSGVYNIDPNNIVVWGTSAGGWLAALAGTSGDVKDLEDPRLGYENISSKVQAAVDLYGPINFLTLEQELQQNGGKYAVYSNLDSQFSQLLGQKISIISDQVNRADPETYITSDDPPFFIQHGTEDATIPYQQSVNFANKLKAVLGREKVKLELKRGVQHNGTYFRSSENINHILDFLDEN